MFRSIRRIFVSSGSSAPTTSTSIDRVASYGSWPSLKEPSTDWLPITMKCGFCTTGPQRGEGARAPLGSSRAPLPVAVKTVEDGPALAVGKGAREWGILAQIRRLGCGRCKGLHHYLRALGENPLPTLQPTLRGSARLDFLETGAIPSSAVVDGPRPPPPIAGPH